MILTDFHKVSEAGASFVFSCTKWLRRLLGTLRDLIKVHFACFRVVTDNFLPGSTDQWKWGQLAKSWGCQVFVPRSFSQRRFSGCLSDANYSFIKNFSEPSAAQINVRARNLSSTSILVQWGEVPDTYKNGIILSYTVNYKANPEGSLQRSQVVNASIREVTLTGLDKNTAYEIEMFANTSKGGGNESEPVTVKMDEVYHCTGY